jgi:Tfp pilus assembly protein PilF
LKINGFFGRCSAAAAVARMQLGLEYFRVGDPAGALIVAA